MAQESVELPFQQGKIQPLKVHDAVRLIVDEAGEVEKVEDVLSASGDALDGPEGTKAGLEGRKPVKAKPLLVYCGLVPRPLSRRAAGQTEMVTQGRNRGAEGVVVRKAERGGVGHGH